jgi:predicted permease
MSSVIAVAFPVFAIIAAGLVAGRLKLASAADSAALNRFVFRFAMPAALFALMSGASGLRGDDGAIALAYGGPAIAVILSAYFIARRFFAMSPPVAGAHAFASTIGNAVFLGLPIALSIDDWGRPFVVLMLVEGIVVIGIGAALMAAPADGGTRRGLAGAGEFILRPLKNPLVVGALAGFVSASAGIAYPQPVLAIFEILGRAAGPTALFSLGLFLATHPMPPLKATAGRIAAIAFVKMAVLPALAFSLLALLGVADPAYRGAMALFTVTPTAIGAFVMSSQYGHYVSETVAAIAVTTALSVLSVSAVLVVFS